MTDIPQHSELDEAIRRARAGELSAQQFAEAFGAATLMIAITDRAEAGDADAVLPFVIEVDEAPFGVAFTTAAQFETFTAQTPFVLSNGAALGRTWPGELGLAINPGAEPSLMLGAAQISALLESLAGPAVQGSIPAGTSVRVGAPEESFDPAVIAALQDQVRQAPQVRAVYHLAIAQGDSEPQSVIGVEPATPGAPAAQSFAAAVVAAAPELATVAFVDLHGSLLESAKRYTAPID